MPKFKITLTMRRTATIEAESRDAAQALVDEWCGRGFDGDWSMADHLDDVSVRATTEAVTHAIASGQIREVRRGE